MANPKSSVYATYMFPGSPFGPEKVDESTLPRVSSKEPLVGYRVWHLSRETRHLKSAYKKTTWPFRQKMTRGLKGETDETNFSLGIHACKQYEALIKNTEPVETRIWDIFPSVGLWSDYKCDVAGEVYLWGEVKECPRGYLAEFAYPKRLWMPEKTDPVTVMQLEENYGVPVELNPDFGEWKPNSLDYLFGSTSPWISYKLTTSVLPTKTSKNFSFFKYDDVISDEKKDENKP